MDEVIARDVVARLRARGAFAHAHPVGVYRHSVRIVIPDGREAIWDADGAAGLEAVIMRNGVLVGLVGHIAGSEVFDVPQIVDAILRADYDAPVAKSAPVRSIGAAEGTLSRPPTPAPRQESVRDRLRRVWHRGG